MKMKNSMKIAALCLAACAAVACNDAEYDTLGVHAFVSESLSGKGGPKVTITENGADAEVTACLSVAAPHDVKLRFEVDPAVLELYNQKQASSYTVLPAEVIEMNPEVTIKAGEFSASPTKIHLKPIPKEYAGESYALPLRLVCIDGSVPTTSTTATYVIPTDAIMISSYPMWTGGAGLTTTEGFPLTLPEFTIEVRFQVSNTANRNRAVFSGGDVLLRFEDPQNNTAEHAAHSLVQFQGNGWYLNPTMSFKPNVWQHLALTYDGAAVTLYVNGAFAGRKEGKNSPEFGGASWFGGAGDSGGHGTGNQWWAGCKILCAEARIWSVCRTEAQIQNNITSTSAKSKGLEAYWRFNEGSGKIFQDVTGNGHTLTTDIEPTWIENIKSTDEATPWP